MRSACATALCAILLSSVGKLCKITLMCNCIVCDSPVKCGQALGDHVGETHVEVQARKWTPFSGATTR